MIPSNGAEFDLESLQNADRQLKQGPLYMFIAGIVVFGGILALVVLERFSVILGSGLFSSEGAQVAIVTAVFVIGLVFMSISLPRFLVGAQRIRIDDGGVGLLYRSGGTRWYRWADPGCRFVLQDYRAYPEVVRQGTAFAFYGDRYGSRRSLLSQEAFDTLLHAVSERHLIASQHKGSDSLYPHPPTIYKIRGNPKE